MERSPEPPLSQYYNIIKACSKPCSLLNFDLTKPARLITLCCTQQERLFLELHRLFHEEAEKHQSLQGFL